MSKGKRFEKIYSQGVMESVAIWVDRETGVNYLFHQSGYSGGLTPLLDGNGNVVITPREIPVAEADCQSVEELPISEIPFDEKPIEISVNDETQN